MSSRIEDGTGSGNCLRVDSRFRARTLSDSRSDLVTENQNGLVFAVPLISVTPTTGANVFCWIGNLWTGNMYVHRVEIVGASSDVIEARLDTLPASLTGGTVVALTSLNTGKPFFLPASAAFNSPSTINAQAGNALSGTSGTAPVVGVFPLGTSLTMWEPPSRLIIVQNNAFLLKTQSGNQALSCVVYLSVDPPYVSQ